MMKITKLQRKWKTITNGKTSYVHGLEDLMLWRWHYSPNWFIDLMQSLSKLTAESSAETDKLILKVTQKCKGTRIAKIILGGKKNIVENSHFSISKLTIKLQQSRLWLWYRHNDRHTKQWNETESLVKNLQSIHFQLGC